MSTMHIDYYQPRLSLSIVAFQGFALFSTDPNERQEENLYGEMGKKLYIEMSR